VAALTGPLRMECPVCWRPLTIPVYSAWNGHSVTLTLDRPYLVAHVLTHSHHPGEPVPLAA
jgi:hypothetical protein